MKLETIHPNKEETYEVGTDDHCLYVKSNHLSKSMCKWIAENYEKIFAQLESGVTPMPYPDNFTVVDNSKTPEGN